MTMLGIRLATAVLLIQTLSSCGEQSVQPDNLPEDITPEMVERYKRVIGHRRPSAALVDAVEAKIAHDPCVGDLNKWERLYSFGLDDEREVDENTVLFDFREAGVFGFRAGRRVTAPAEWVNIDDRDYDLVFGKFDRTTGKLVIDACGPNLRKPT